MPSFKCFAQQCADSCQGSPGLTSTYSSYLMDRSPCTSIMVSVIRRYGMSEFLDLYDYRHRVAAMYRERTQAIMVGADPMATWQRFLAVRNELFAHHPQSPLDEGQRRHFQGLPYFPYNPAMRFVVDVDTNVESTRLTVVMNADETMSMTTVG